MLGLVVVVVVVDVGIAVVLVVVVAAAAAVVVSIAYWFDKGVIGDGPEADTKYPGRAPPGSVHDNDDDETRVWPGCAFAWWPDALKPRFALQYQLSGLSNACGTAGDVIAQRSQGRRTDNRRGMKEEMVRTCPETDSGETSALKRTKKK